ncbi:homoserine dehydrogenase [Bacillus sp. FJAT-29790]|uniref:homoserine dehydrogenase n=1 Tax=Bacillus sp. FJAT-29790 TaxID=1895002 RepID=UPI001C23EE37|nr:homoserine dehydrogenase [Bacillus sp. FJAT-29790]
MSAIHIALLGYGTVGKGVFQTVKTHQNRLKSILGKEVKIVAVLVKNLGKHQLSDEEVILTDDFEDIIKLEKLDVIIDAIVGKEPGFSYLQQAIHKGCHVITANKEMFAHHGTELKRLANEQDVTIGFEATVAGGIPVIQTLKQLLNVNKVEKVQGILNGTSNFILTKMREDGLPFDLALKLAQENGFAEADPTNDIEGYDAFYKAVILSELVFGESPKWEESIREGITAITSEQMDVFSSLGFRIKHVASIEKTTKGIQCTVKPVLVNEAHPFYQIEGVQNSVSIDADIVGNISLQGPGAGMFPTASAIIEDLIHLGKKSNRLSYLEQENESNKDSIHPFWLIGGGVNASDLPAPIQVIERIHSNVLIVQAPEEAVNAIHIPDVYYYQILGKLECKKILVSN